MDYVQLGWLPLPTLQRTHHGEWSVHVVWLCGCRPIEPINEKEAARCRLSVKNDGGFTPLGIE